MKHIKSINELFDFLKNHEDDFLAKNILSGLQKCKDCKVTTDDNGILFAGPFRTSLDGSSIVAMKMITPKGPTDNYKVLVDEVEIDAKNSILKDIYTFLLNNCTNPHLSKKVGLRDKFAKYTPPSSMKTG